MLEIISDSNAFKVDVNIVYLELLGQFSLVTGQLLSPKISYFAIYFA